MAGLLDSCQKYFNCSSLYEVLEIAKDASDSAIKKAYYKLSLKVHPDRVGEQEKENATVKFQTLGKVYSILSDKEKRKVYDETGVCGDDDDFFKSDMNWEEYWRLLFKKITEEDIVQFERKYRGSEEEKNDIKQLYEEYKGDMDSIMNSLMCATADDEPRIREVIEEMIENKEVKSFKAFTKESQKKRDTRKRKADKEAAEAEKLAEEMGLRGDESLRAMIQKRNKAREEAADDFFSALEAKYGGKSAKKGGPAKKKQKKDEESDDEEPKPSRKAKAGKRKN